MPCSTSSPKILKLHLFQMCEHTLLLPRLPTEILLAGGVNENEDLGGLATLK